MTTYLIFPQCIPVSQKSCLNGTLQECGKPYAVQFQQARKLLSQLAQHDDFERTCPFSLPYCGHTVIDVIDGCHATGLRIGIQGENSFPVVYSIHFIERFAQRKQRKLEIRSRIYMIGDNPAADVRGANSAGDPWRSILVCTGEQLRLYPRITIKFSHNCPMMPWLMTPWLPHQKWNAHSVNSVLHNFYSADPCRRWVSGQRQAFIRVALDPTTKRRTAGWDNFDVWEFTPQVQALKWLLSSPLYNIFLHISPFLGGF